MSGKYSWILAKSTAVRASTAAKEKERMRNAEKEEDKCVT